MFSQRQHAMLARMAENGQERPFAPDTLNDVLDILLVGKFTEKMISHIKSIAASCLVAAGLTYFSLLVPGRVIAVCSNIGTPIYCPVLAYGFPLPFIADSQGVSPVGSVARDPLSLMAGADDVLWPQLGLSILSWMLAVVVSRLAWRRRRRRRNSGRHDSSRST